MLHDSAPLIILQHFYTKSKTATATSAATTTYNDRVAQGLLAYRCATAAAKTAKSENIMDGISGEAMLVLDDMKAYPIAPTRPVRKVVHSPRPDSDPIQAERTARALLAERVTLEARRAAQTKRAVATEARQRQLLEARIASDAVARTLAVQRATQQAVQQASMTVEARQRGLLQARIVTDASAAAQQAATEAAKQWSMTTEARQRRLLEARITADATAAVQQASRVAEARQRALLIHRLNAQESAYAQVLAEREIMAAIQAARQQPKTPDVEAALQQKYGSIDCIGDRAYTILQDLGVFTEQQEQPAATAAL